MPSDKPRTVRGAFYAYGLALLITWATLAAVLVSHRGTLPALPSLALPPGGSPVLTVILYLMIAIVVAVGVFLAFGLPVLFLYQINRKRQWARIGLLVLTVWYVAVLLRDAVTHPSAVSASALIALVSLALQVAAMVLLFSPSSNAWFRQPHS